MNTFSRVIIFITLSCITGYIAIIYRPFEDFSFSKKENFVADISQLKVLVQKEVERVATSTTSKVSLEDTDVVTTTTSVVSTNITPVSKVTTTKEGAYEVLETHNSDTDESYRPLISPCVTPMEYTLGTLDPRFNISRENVLAIIKEAVAIWEDAAGTTLFTHNPSGALKINLKYDDRQATTINLGYLALEIDNTKKTAEDIRTSYEREKTSYTNDSSAFNEDATQFQERYASYNERVKQYNEKGGATKSEYDTMMLELELLKTDSTIFETRRQDLLRRMEEINTKVKRYNELVAHVNTLIRRSNSIGSRTFTEGLFTPSSNTIDIFQYSDETKLKRVIIHELGHAIGIGHVDTVMSIMYSFNSGTSTSLSYEDRKALKDVCSSF
ncbi:MAG: matrixin family metalloprotease [Candidatus Pacebacteria bacterium]|nr:matrixin family metalloprotease [Candidatus Paceibacterota bacterium]